MFFPLLLASLAPQDRIIALPTYGELRAKQYAGLLNATAAANNKLFYWFAECDCGNAPDVPLLLWLNGGPGASSMTGSLIEKLGPQTITANATLVDNPNRITDKHHLLIVDNPVGSGFSSTTNGAYVRSEYELRTQFLVALRHFFSLHPEYKRNPFWVMGESYAGHYLPNIAWEIAVNASEVQLQGVVIGNGMYNMRLQYPSLGTVAFAAGVIDEKVLKELEARQASCLAMIAKEPSTAGDYCENVTVRWLYSPTGPAGQLFYYDVGISDGTFFDTLTTQLGAYLNRADVKAALHVGSDARWTQSDETGPVADALLADWTVNSDTVVEKLLALKLKVRMYNGVRDLSSCNHIGNLAVLNKLQWAGASAFAAAPSVAWPTATNVEGYMRGVGLLQYATVLRTGHLVPTIVPLVFKTLLAMMLS